MKSLQLSIYGRVQGVFFRKHTREKAIELGVSGTVRNCFDGSVEVFAEAEEDIMENFVLWCHRGPSGALVEKVDMHETTLKNYSGFVILKD